MSISETFKDDINKEIAASRRWVRLQEIVALADSNPSLDNALKQVEMLYEIVKPEAEESLHSNVGTIRTSCDI
jgi:hypothetical protein